MGSGCASSACMIDRVLINHRQPCGGQNTAFTLFEPHGLSPSEVWGKGDQFSVCDVRCNGEVVV